MIDSVAIVIKLINLLDKYSLIYYTFSIKNV